MSVRDGECTAVEQWRRLTRRAVLTTLAIDASLRIPTSSTLRRGLLMFSIVLIAALATAEADAPAPVMAPDRKDWYPFTFPLDDANLDSIDLTGLLDAPAGKHGFLTVGADGHFYFADRTRVRFFGTNIGGKEGCPEKEIAEATAARLAKYGVNLLRIHAIDGRWGPLIDYEAGGSRRLNAQSMDRLDYFFDQLKRRGIYVYFDLLDYRQFMPADGVTDAEKLQRGWTDSIKGATVFNARMIELQKELAEQFLTHRNPYTGLRYVDDPAVAVVEITNENSLFYFHNTRLTLPVYIDELRQRWNGWLVERHGDRGGLLRAWAKPGGGEVLESGEDPQEGSVLLPMAYLYHRPETAGPAAERNPARVDDMVRFFFELQRRYYATMREHLHRIGVRVPITGTNQTFCPASNLADAANDFMSRNNYWCHPDVQAKPRFRFRNLPAVQADLPRVSNPITEVASSAVSGKPMIVPEFNFPWPNEHRAEGLLLMTAYACLQDWDGLLFFSYGPSRQDLMMFQNQSDPVRWGEFPAAALMFHRGDVATARNTVEIAYSERAVFTAGPSHGRAERSPYRYLSYLSKVRNSYFDEAYPGSADLVVASGPAAGVDFSKAKRVYRLAEPAWNAWDERSFAAAAREFGLPGYSDLKPEEKRYTSDTGELLLDYGTGLFTVRTPRTQGAVGFLGCSGPLELGELRLAASTNFAAVVATSLDGQPLGQSRRVLVTAVARAENTGQTFDAEKKTVPEEGQTPVLAEPVRCEVQLKVPGPAMVHALDSRGMRREAVPAEMDGDVLRFVVDDARSPWCEVVVAEDQP
jgi:hypothetical protein